MRTLTTFLCLSVLAACGGAVEATYPEYGHPQVIDTETRSGTLKTVIAPWEAANGRSAKSALEGALTNAPIGERFSKKSESDIRKIPKTRLMIASRDLKKRRAALYIGCTAKRNDDFVRTVQTVGPQKAFGSKETMALLVEQAKEACDQRPSSAKYAATRAAVRTAPGKGIKRGDVKHVVYTWDMRYEGSFMRIKSNIHVLLKDGTAIRNPTAPIQDFNVDASRALQPKSWSQWRKKRGKFQVRKDDGDWKNMHKSAQALKPAKRGKKYRGTFDYWDTSGTMMFGATVSHGSYTMKRNGTYSASNSFTRDNGNGMGDIADLGSVFIATNCNKDGGGTAMSANTSGVVMGSSTKRDDCGDGKSGSYKIHGYAIELNANDGSVHRFPFYATGKKSFMIGTRNYSRGEDD